MSQFGLSKMKKVNVPFVKNLPMFIVLIVVIIIMSGYALTTGNNIKRNAITDDSNKRLLDIIQVIFTNITRIIHLKSQYNKSIKTC